MAQTFLQTQKAHATGRHQRSGQRADRRGYPDDGVPWGQLGWGSGGGAPAGPAPTLTYITPNNGVAGVMEAMTGEGTGFSATSTFQVDGVPITSAWYDAAPTFLSADWTPPAAGTFMFTVKNADGQVSAQMNPFSATAADLGVLDGTIDEVKAYVNGLPSNDNRDDAIQALIDHERTHRNRASLVSWLDQQTGVE